jgi:hypothetical protein
MPEPTTAQSSIAVPKNSAASRREFIDGDIVICIGRLAAQGEPVELARFRTALDNEYFPVLFEEISKALLIFVCSTLRPKRTSHAYPAEHFIG